VDDEIATVLRRAQGAAADSLAWFTDYNSHNIASRLTDMGVPYDEAIEAGNSVQGYVMAKTARKRIRNYLRNRDSIWISDVNDDIEAGGDFPVKRTKTYRLSSFYEELPGWGKNCSIDSVVDVMSEKGLTGRDIAAVFTHTPSVSMARVRQNVEETNPNGDSGGMDGETLEDTIDRAYSDLLLDSLKLRKYDARKVLRSCPGLLTKRGSKSAEEVMAILFSLNVTPASLSRDKSSIPTLLSRSPAAIFRLIAFLSGDGVRMPVDKIGSFIRRSECARLLDRVAPLPQLSTNGAAKQGSNGLYVLHSLLNNDEDGAKAETEKTYAKMYRAATFLREEAGIKDVGKLVTTNPDILMTDVNDRIISLFDFLCDDIGIDENEVPKLIEAFPTILLTDVKRMKSVVEYLTSLNVSSESLPSIFQSFPSILTLDIEKNIIPVVEFLLSIGVTNIGRFITRLPPVLSYSVEKELSPKWQFLTTVCQYARFEVVRFPAYFSYPLDRVIMSRYRYLRDIKGIPLRTIHMLSVDQVLRFGDDDFSRFVGRDKNGKAYREYMMSRRNQVKRKGKQKLNLTKSQRRRGNTIEQ